MTMAAMHIVSTALAPAAGKSTAAEDVADAEQTPFTELLGEQMEAGLAADTLGAAEPKTTAGAAPTDKSVTDPAASVVDPAALGIAPPPAAPVADTSRTSVLDQLRKLDPTTSQKADALKAAMDDREGKSAQQAAAKDIAATLATKDSVAQSVSAAKATPQFELTSVAGTEAPTPTQALPMQQGVERTAQLAAMTLQQPVGSERWNTELGQTVHLLVRAEQNSATLHVTPADLGPIEVQIDMSGDQATLTFTAQNADTRSALENAMPRLRDLLADSGIALGDAQVNQQSAEQRDTQAQSQRPRGGESISLAGTSSGATAANVRVGLVDTFA